MNDFIDHLLLRSFGPAGSTTQLLPRKPSRFEEWHGDPLAPAEEEMPATEAAPRPNTESAESPVSTPQLLIINRQERGILVPPPPRHQEAPTIHLHHEASSDEETQHRPPVTTVVTPQAAPQVPVAPRRGEPEQAVQRPIVSPRETIQPESGTASSTPVTPSSVQPAPRISSAPDPVQPAPDPARMPMPDRDAVAAKSTVHVHIGRIEVQVPSPSKAAPPPAAPPVRARAPFRPPLTLRDYMDKRRR